MLIFLGFFHINYNKFIHRYSIKITLDNKRIPNFENPVTKTIQKINVINECG